MNEFNDIDYDGIVLKIPSFFIKVNNLEETIAELHQKLDACRISMYLPDHINNLNELENYKDKKERLDFIKKQRDSQIKENDEYYKKIESGEIYELVWEPYSFNLGDDDIRIGNRTFKYSEYFSKRSHVTSEFKKAFFNEVKTVKDLDLFFKENNKMAHFPLHEDLIKMEIGFSAAYALNLQITFRRLGVKLYERGKRDNKLKYKTVTLDKEESGKYFTWHKGHDFSGYTIKGMKLIKN